MGKETEPKEPHPLEGKYVVYSYVESDEGYVEEFLALYRFVDGKYQGIVSPLNFGTGDTDALDDRTIDYLVQNNISEVFDVFSLHGEMPIRSGLVFFTDDRDEDVGQDKEEYMPPGSDNWGEFKLSLEDAHRSLLKDAGIQINHVYFNDQGELIITPDINS